MNMIPWQEFLPYVLPTDFAKSGIPGLRWQPLHDSLAQAVAIPRPHEPEFVTDAMVQQWGEDVSTQSLVEAGRRNLEATLSVDTFQMLQAPNAGVPLLHAMAPAGNQAGWLNSPQTLERMAGGKPVIWAPMPRVLIVVPESSFEHVRASFDAMEALLERQPATLVGAPWTIVDGQLKPWIPSPDHPLHQRAAGLWDRGQANGQPSGVPWDRLVPVVHPVQWLYSETRFGRVPVRQISPEIIEAVGIDQGDSTVIVDAMHLRNWPAEVSVQDLFRRARDNMRPHAHRDSFQIGRQDGSQLPVFFSVGPAHYETSLLAFPEVFEELVKDERFGQIENPKPVIWAPTEGKLIVVPEQLDENLALAQQVAEGMAAKSERPLSLVPLTVEEGKLVPWLPAEGHQLEMSVAVQRNVELGQQYEAQKRFFDETEAGKLRRDEGKLWFAPTWVYPSGVMVTSIYEGMFTSNPELVGLLPEADVAMLFREAGDGAEPESITVPFKYLHAVLDLEPWNDTTPPRWRMTEFVDAAAWTALSGNQINVPELP